MAVDTSQCFAFGAGALQKDAHASAPEQGRQASEVSYESA
jgi:hypothetical protein